MSEDGADPAGFTLGYLHGFMAAYIEHDPSVPANRPCEDCSCAMTDPDGRLPALEYAELPAAMDFQRAVRDYLEQYNAVGEDDLVAQVVVCPEGVRALVEQR